MSPENEKLFRLFIRTMAAAVSLLVFGLILALLEAIGLEQDGGAWAELVILFVAIFTGGAAARPAANKIKKALEAFVDELEEDE